VIGAFGHKWAPDLYQALTLLLPFLDLLPDLIFGRVSEEIARVWKG